MENQTFMTDAGAPTALKCVLLLKYKCSNSSFEKTVNDDKKWLDERIAVVFSFCF